MEFLYRAGDERRSRSLSPPPSGPSAPDASADGRRAPEADVDETRRQAEKARIRERILREETVDRFELELEVRIDLVQRLRQRSDVLKARGPQLPVVPVPPPARVVQHSSSSPVAPKANAPAASLVKRKSPVHGAASTASVDTSSKKQNVIRLTCTVCGISANAEKAMQDHLNGKNHKRKAAALAAQPTTEPEPEEEEPSDDFKPTKFTMVTDVGALNLVTQMDGYLLCEVCNVRTADRVTMMCHFQGTKHISKAQKASSTPPKKCVNKRAVIGGDSDTVVLDVEGEPHTVRREGRFLLCKRCGVMAPSESGMRLHLSGKKHKNKANASSVASVNVTNGGTEAANEGQVIDKDTTTVDETDFQIEAPLSGNPMQENASDLSNSEELQEKVMATSANKDVVTVESSEALGKEAVANAVGDTDLEVEGVRHPLRRVEGILLCPCCDVKATSETVMRSHLVGKKHKNKMTSTAASTAEVNVPSKTGKAGGEADTMPPTPMELDAQAGVEAVIVTPTEHADDAIEPAGKPVKVQVEGKMFTVLQQENGILSCELCGVRGCNKDAMLKHLYTRTHWDKACLTEKEEQAREAAAALVNDDNGGSIAGAGTAHR